MKIPKTPIEFDYDLWTTEDGKCMVRIKSTGEVTEVDREVMRVLRSEEKKMRRDYSALGAGKDETAGRTVLSLDEVVEQDVKQAAWLADPTDYEETVITAMTEQDFLKTLTAKQRDVYEKCVIGGQSLRAYARELGVDFSTVKEAQNAVRKKFEKYFCGHPLKR